nr:uncharacterized protein LOC118679991 [Bactrocera oleae]
MEEKKKAIVYLIAQIAARNKKLEEIRKRRQLRLKKISSGIHIQNALLHFLFNNSRPTRLWKHERYGNFWVLDVACSDQLFKESFRMSTESFTILCNELKSIGRRNTTYNRRSWTREKRNCRRSLAFIANCMF